MRENLKNIQANSEMLIKALNTRISSLEKDISTFPKTERELINIKRKFQISEGLFVFLMQKKAEAGIAKASNLPSNKIIDSARISRTPTKPKKSLNFLIGILSGLVFPIMVLSIRDFF